MSQPLRTVFAGPSILLLLTLHCAADSRPLEGDVLRCCTVKEGPIVFEDATKPLGFDGIAIEYLTLLQEKLGFRCSSVTLYDEANTTGFTGFIKYMEGCTIAGSIPKDDQNCRCDIGVGGWRVNEERIGRVDFLPPFVFDYYRVLTHVDSTFTSTGGAFFLTAFNSDVWISISMLIVVFTFLKLLDRRFAPQDESFKPLPADQPLFRRCRRYLLKSHIPYRLRRAIQSTLSKMIGQSTADIVGEHSSTRQWVLNFVIVLCGLFLVLAYEATMTAALVQETIQSDFRNINDIKTCRIPAAKMCIPQGSAVQVFWNKAIAPKVCHRGHGGPQLFDNYDTAIERTAAKNCTFFMALRSTVEYAANSRYCGTLVTTGDSFFGGGISFVLPRHSEMTAVMSNATLQLRNEDVIPTVEMYLSRQGLCTITTKPSLTFSKLKVFFILAFGACFIIFLEMVVDPQVALNRHKNESAQNDDVELPRCIDKVVTDGNEDQDSN